MKGLLLLFFQFMVMAAYSSDNCPSEINEMTNELPVLQSSIQDILLPDHCQNFKKLQHLVHQIKERLDELDRTETGIGVSQIFSSTYKLYIEKSKLLEGDFIQCQKILYDRCYSKNKAKILSNVLPSVFEELKNNKLFRSATPGGDCFERAYLISKFLAEKGYHSKMTVIHSPIILGKNPFNSNMIHKYDIHAVVTVETESGIYVLDPQFVDNVMKIEDYMKKATGQNCRDLSTLADSKNDLECTYSSKPSYVPVFPSGSELHTSDLLQVKSMNYCGWALEGISLDKLKNSGEDPALHAQSTKQVLINFYTNMLEFEKDSSRQDFLKMILLNLK